jgi:membrane protease YdiL (CAAX protease family)
VTTPGASTTTPSVEPVPGAIQGGGARGASLAATAMLRAALLGSALLLSRPWVVEHVRSTVPVLVALYVAVLAISVLPRGTTSFRPPLGVTAPFLLGAAAVTLAWLAVRSPAPFRAGSYALALNTLAAVAEEALFRRALYGWLIRWGAPVAVIGSAAAFALIHVPTYGLAALPVDLGAGLVLSWQRWASGRWEVAAATHALANALVVLG